MAAREDCSFVMNHNEGESAWTSRLSRISQGTLDRLSRVRTVTLTLWNQSYLWLLAESTQPPLIDPKRLHITGHTCSEPSSLKPQMESSPDADRSRQRQLQCQLSRRQGAGRLYAAGGGPGNASFRIHENGLWFSTVRKGFSAYYKKG